MCAQIIPMHLSLSLLSLYQFHAHRVGVVLAVRDLAAALLLVPALLCLPASALLLTPFPTVHLMRLLCTSH